MTSPLQPHKYDIFISYRTHKDWVETLARNLKAQGYSIFIDTWELIPGQSFTQRIHQALTESRCAILLATPDAEASGWVQAEYEIMFNQSRSASNFFFIPIVLGDFPNFPFLETIQSIDFKDSQSDHYRQAFQRLLCGLKQQPAGDQPNFSGVLDIPQLNSEQPRELVPQEQSFLNSIFMYLDGGDIVLLLSQADANPQIYAHALCQQAEALYGKQNTLHISPPASTKIDTAAYFSRLAQQCHLDASISDSNQWSIAIAEKLDNDDEIFLLLSGFENGEATARQDLASEICSLNERYPFNFFPVIMGSEKLAAMKYELGELSMLNNAQDMNLPDLCPQDLKQIFSKRYAQFTLDEQELEKLLDFTGRHPRLVHYCLQSKVSSAEQGKQLLANSPLLAQLFTRFHSQQEQQTLCE